MPIRGGSADVVRTLEGGLARGVLEVYKGGGWVKNDQKRTYVNVHSPIWFTYHTYLMRTFLSR